MIIATESASPSGELGAGQLRVVTQSDHAHLAAEILRLWRRDGLPDHARRETILLAAREHDNGWREYDAAPRIDAATGCPLDFRNTAEADRQLIWQRAVERHRGQHPEASLLILMHARQLHRRLRDAGTWDALLNAWDDLYSELRGDRAEADLAADYRLIDLSDTLSLALADRWQERLRYRGMLIEPRPAPSFEGVDSLAIDPFPLAGATTFRLPCRRVPARSYRSDSDFTITLAEARWTVARVRLEPLTEA